MSKITIRKVTCLILVCSMFISSFSLSVCAGGISPRYNNVHYATSDMLISSSGQAEITNSFSGDPSVFTKAIITTYIEKRILGIFWTKVDIGQTNDEWIDTIYTNVYSGTHSVQLPSTGTYRATVEYVIYGSGGSADTITKEIKKTY